MPENTKKDNKVLIIIILSLLLVGVSSYVVYDKFIADNNSNEKESKNSENDLRKEEIPKEECVTDKSKRKYCITANLYTNDEEYKELDKKIKFSVTLPEGYYLEDDYLEGDAIVDERGKKVGINPCRPEKLNQGEKMPTKISDLDNSTDEGWVDEIYDSEYYTQNGLKIFLTHQASTVSGYDEGEWSQLRYIRGFYINKDDIVFYMSFFMTQKELPEDTLNALKESAASIKIYE